MGKRRDFIDFMDGVLVCIKCVARSDKGRTPLPEEIAETAKANERRNKGKEWCTFGYIRIKWYNWVKAVNKERKDLGQPPMSDEDLKSV